MFSSVTEEGKKIIAAKCEKTQAQIIFCCTSLISSVTYSL